MTRDADECSSTSRRAFLGTGLLGGALAAARPLLGGDLWGQGAGGSGAKAGAADGPAAQSLAPTAAPPETSPAAAAEGFELEEATFTGLQAAMAAGRQTSRGLVG